MLLIFFKLFAFWSHFFFFSRYTRVGTFDFVRRFSHRKTETKPEIIIKTNKSDEF